jgi:hypothetical protein
MGDFLKWLLPNSQALIIIVGAFISVRWYYLKRRKYPRLNLTQEVSHLILDDKHILIRVKLTLENKSEILIRLGSDNTKDENKQDECSLTRIQQIAPLLSTFELDKIKIGGDPVKPECTEVEWPLLDERKIEGSLAFRELEPGEIEELFVEFVTDNDKSAILVYTYIVNPRKKNLGWHKSTVYKIP